MDEFQEQELLLEHAITNEPVDHDRVIHLISTGAWEEVLVLLTKDMDPWNIDILKLSARFTEHIEQMRGIDLKVPARVLLAAAIIYRLKSETLQYAQDDETIPEETEGALDDLNLDWQMEGGNIILPPIQLPLRRTPKRNVTLDELVGALEKAMVIKTRRESREFFAIELAGEDISVRIEDLYTRINSFLEGKDHAFFSQLLQEKKTKDDIIKTFASLLHLSNQERINLEQPELFGEIKIMLHPNVLHGVDEGPKAEEGEF